MRLRLWLLAMVSVVAVSIHGAAAAPLKFGFHVRDSVSAYGPRYEGGTWESHFGAALKQEMDERLAARFPGVVELSAFPPAKDAPPADAYIVLEQAIARFSGRGVMTAEAQATVSIFGAEREPLKDIELSSHYETSYTKDTLPAKADAAVREVARELSEKLLAALADPELQTKMERSVAAAREKRDRPKVTPMAAPVAHAFGRLLLTTAPAGMKVFLDDVYWGVSDADGKLKIAGVPAGAHVLRLDKSGYKETKLAITVQAGDNPVAFTAEVAPPKPLKEAEIEEALRYDVPKARINAMIQEYGVDFDLTKAAEIRLLDAGADKQMLQNIAAGRKTQ